MLDDSCPTCGEPITEEMREAARQKYMAKRKRDRDQVFELAQAAKQRRKGNVSKTVYPWEK